MHSSRWLAGAILSGSWVLPSWSLPGDEPVLVRFDEILSVAGTDPADRAGHALASQGDLLAVGVPWRDQGIVQIFERTGGQWVATAVLAPSDPTVQEFGFALAIDGDRLAVGAPTSTTDGPEPWDGRVLTFVRDANGVWMPEQVLYAPPGDGAQRWGASVDLDADVLVAGTHEGDTPPGLFDGGVAFVFRHDGSAWALDAALHELVGTESYDRLGWDVAVQGSTIAVSRPRLQGEEVLIFEHDGAQWVVAQALTPPNALEYVAFGTALELAGSTLCVGAPSSQTQTGRVHVYDRVGASWSHSATIEAHDAQPTSSFGNSLSLSGDLLAIGASRDDEQASDMGAGYLFRRAGAHWIEQAKFVPPPLDGIDFFGASITLESLHGWVAGGAPYYDGARGAAGVFDVLLPVTAYCFGDGSGADCPCANLATSGRGCANSSGQGAALDSSGSTSVLEDDLRFVATNLIANQAALLFAGAETLNGGAGFHFGDGLRCAGVGVVRLGIALPNGGGSAFFGPGLASAGGWQPGDERAVQAWYRDPSSSPCGTGFNLSPGLLVRFER